MGKKSAPINARKKYVGRGIDREGDRDPYTVVVSQSSSGISQERSAGKHPLVGCSSHQETSALVFCSSRQKTKVAFEDEWVGQYCNPSTSIG
ncbi:hypothetical protein D8674_013841 [Pyrus ussuriensis x Pyrus communis]|uniref:Uncharacterized protein n=1 Tax=Pyrus ussuriensis x Pyrus communis TaxID=2448454 RepID=A0A5N5GWA4_9ROSA|nr:hypothetical protein D8674_013841 [Pyrus ussuriensis x Pyrus communis]